MAEGKGLLSGFLHGLSRLLGPAARQTSAPEQPTRTPDFAQELEKALEAVKAKQGELKDGSLVEALGRRKVTEEQRLADRMRAMEEAHARVREDILAFHRSLGTGLDAASLTAAQDHLLELDEILTKGQQGHIEDRMRAAVATRLLANCAPLAWQVLLTLMERKGVTWPDPMGLSPWDDPQAVAVARARQVAEAEHGFESSLPKVSADRVFGIVKAWKTEYPPPDSSPWKHLVIEAVAYGILGYLLLTASRKLRDESEELKGKMGELLGGQASRIQNALQEGIRSVSDAEDLIIRATQVCCGVVPKIAWHSVENLVHSTAQSIAEGIGAAPNQQD